MDALVVFVVGQCEVEGIARMLSAKVPLLMKESPVRVREIWLEKFHTEPDKLAGTMAKDTPADKPPCKSHVNRQVC